MFTVYNDLVILNVFQFQYLCNFSESDLNTADDNEEHFDFEIDPYLRDQIKEEPPQYSNR